MRNRLEVKLRKRLLLLFKKMIGDILRKSSVKLGKTGDKKLRNIGQILQQFRVELIRLVYKMVGGRF